MANGKHVRYITDPDGKYFICLPDPSVIYGPCVFCGNHIAVEAFNHCRAIQYWDDELGTYALYEGGNSNG